MHEYWRPAPPASEQDIARLRHAAGFELPAAYLDLLQRSNGGEGPLALAPLWLQLWSADRAADFSRFALYARRYPGHFFFASNGAGENLAMRRAPDGALEIVAIDITLGPDSARVIATDFETLIAAIGK